MHPESFDDEPLGGEDPVAREAAEWLARQDRGLTESEARQFERWESADFRHAAEHARLARAWAGFDDALQVPTIVEMARRLEVETRSKAPRRRVAWVLPLAAAAAVALFLGMGGLGRRSVSLNPSAPATYRVVPSAARMMTLEDGSTAQLRDDSAIEVEFTPAARRVRLVRGEAHFTVAKNPARPFIVTAGRVAVRAVGTVFNVRIDPGAVDVLVTDGKVRVDDSVRGESLLSPSVGAAAPGLLEAGQRATIALQPSTREPSPAPVANVAPPEIEESLAWQGNRLVFNRTPLSEAVDAFNRNGTRRLVLGDAALSGRQLGGTFRTDNVEGFVRLLEQSAGVKAEKRGEDIVLWSVR